MKEVEGQMISAPARISQLLIWRHRLASLLVIAAISLGITSLFGFVANTTAYEVRIFGLISLTGSFLGPASIVVFIGAAAILSAISGSEVRFYRARSRTIWPLILEFLVWGFVCASYGIHAAMIAVVAISSPKIFLNILMRSRDLLMNGVIVIFFCLIMSQTIVVL
jgi:hypothetical protein